MNRSLIILSTIFLLGSASRVRAAGLESYYTLPCGANNYTIIPIIDIFSIPPYTLFAADGATIIAGPQTSNVFSNINGMAGNNFVVGVIDRHTNAQVLTTITLNAGTSVINGHVYCFCTISPLDVCSALPGADSITGASYIWTSPGGIHYYQSHPYVDHQPPENGIWTISAGFSSSGCNYTLTNSILLSNCQSTAPVKYNYVRTSYNNCKLKAEWSTAQENNSDRFEIETSENSNTDWHKVVTVAAAGNSSTDLRYSADVPPGDASILYIRLKQIDFDGHFTYSTVLKVNINCKNKGDLLSVTPNIVQQNGTITLKLESSADRGKSYIIFYTASGTHNSDKVVTINKSVNQYNFPLVDFTRGIYLVRFVNAEGNWQSNSVKFIIQ